MADDTVPSVLPTAPGSREPDAPPRPPLLPERSDFLEGARPATEKVEAFLAKTLAAAAGPERAVKALVPWMCDVLLSKHSLKAYGRDLTDFVRHMEAQGVEPLGVTADH